MTSPATPRLRAFLLTLIAGSFGLLVLQGCGHEPRDARPSIVLISIDALRRDHLGLHGYPRDVSPHLDRLAQESLVFDRAYTTASWTLISHMSMLTGLLPSQHRVVTRDLALSPQVPLLAERLKDLGYHTMGLTAGGFVGERYGFARGFSHFRVHADGTEMDEHVAEAMAGRPADRPFFLFVHVWDVHSVNLAAPGSTIYDPPGDEYDDLFVADAVQRLEGIDARSIWEGKTRPSDQQLEALVALYDGSISYVDETIGAWLESWRAQGILDRSLVIVTSDHGESLWQRDRINMSHGASYEEGLQVPLLIHFPGGEHAGERRSELVSHIDLLPTLLDCLNLPAEKWLPGASLRHRVQNDRIVMAQWPSMVALQWPFKFDFGKGLIFDLNSDPGELHPISRDSDPERFSQLTERFRQSVSNAKPPPAPGAPIPAISAERDEIERLRQLGYVGED